VNNPPAKAPGSLLTVGHSNRKLSDLLSLLKGAAVQVVVDVRSSPFSRYVPQFNKAEVAKALGEAGFHYLFMGDTIGGKPDDSRYLKEDGSTDYDALRASRRFQGGIDRLLKGAAQGWIIALMCAEEEPRNCHRHLLIARELELARGVAVWHLRADGSRLRALDYLDRGRQLSLF